MVIYRVIAVAVAALVGAVAGYFSTGLLVRSLRPDSEWEVVLAVWIGAVVGALLATLLVAAQLRGKGRY
jgi:ABC-type Co2+ transport system permease subunit